MKRRSSLNPVALAKRLVLIAGIMAWGGTALSQEDPEPDAADRLRATSVVFGVGNAMGWLGGQGERYFKGDRVSIFFGLGYTLSVEDGYPSGVTLAAGARLFTPGRTHRAFLEGSVSQIATEVWTIDGEKYPGSRRYGPGVQVGYQYVSRGGFTALLSAGIGYAVGASPGLSRTGGSANLGLGYTWLRNAAPIASTRSNSRIERMWPSSSSAESK